MASQLVKFIVSVGGRLFKQAELRAAYTKMMVPSAELSGPFERAAYIALRCSSAVFGTQKLFDVYRKTNPVIKAPWERSDFNPAVLHLMLNRVYDMPEVVIDRKRSPTVNVLIPAFDIKSISAGFFGVFMVARYIKNLGFNVRLVFFDNFYFNDVELRTKLRDFPGMEDLLDEHEYVYIGDRRVPLKVSREDTCLATVWYSSYFADKIMKVCGRNRPFLYLIQDYEANFYAGSSLQALADRSYRFSYYALVSSKTLLEFLRIRNIGGLGDRPERATYFHNACSAAQVSEVNFRAFHGSKKKRSLVFYSRPIVNRNMFELGTLAISEAVRCGVLDPKEWDFYGIGLGEADVELKRGVSLTQLPRMTLKEYEERVFEFDLCVTLMASPHPSLIPFDLAAAGSIVVTNTQGPKSQSYFDEFASSIIAVEPALDELVEAISIAAERAKDLDARLEAIRTFRYPRIWSETFTEEHAAFLHRALSGTPMTTPAARKPAVGAVRSGARSQSKASPQETP